MMVGGAGVEGWEGSEDDFGGGTRAEASLEGRRREKASRGSGARAMDVSEERVAPWK